MPTGSRKSRDRHLAKLAERRRLERRRQHRRRMIALGTGVTVAVLGLGAGLFALTRGGGGTASASGTPTPTASATPTVASVGPPGPGGVDCGYQIKAIPNGPNLQPPAAVIDTTKSYEATIKTSMGEIKVELFDDQAPCTVNSFVALANQRFYDGLIFHRVVANFVDQGGDPLGTGTGGPGYQFKDELDNDLTYGPGTLAMANSGPNTNGSQFFIVDSDSGAGQLQHLYTIFGTVTEGLDVVQAINAVQVDAQQKPVTPVTIDSIKIEATTPPSASPSGSESPSASPSPSAAESTAPSESPSPTASPSS
jgi:cyclophilin family peptidyl-prolyl cis-trans isomerase